MDEEDFKKNEYYIENTFKMGKILVIRNEFDLAICKFTEVCFSFEKLLLDQDKYPLNIKWLIDSLFHLGDIYEKKKMVDKSLQFYTLKRKFLELWTSYPEIFVSDQYLITLPQIDIDMENTKNNNDDRVQSLRKEVLSFFHEIHEAAEMKSTMMLDNDLATISENIKKQYQSTKKEERTKACIFLRDLAKTRKEEEMKTFFGRISNYFNEYSNTIIIIIIIFIIVVTVFVLILLIYYNYHVKSKLKEKQQRISYLRGYNSQKKSIKDDNYYQDYNKDYNKLKRIKKLEIEQEMNDDQKQNL